MAAPHKTRQVSQSPTKGEALPVSDLHLAVFLKTKYDLALVDMKRSGGRLTFIFDTGGRDAQDLIRSFYAGDDSVSAREFVQELRDLKALVHNY